MSPVVRLTLSIFPLKARSATEPLVSAVVKSGTPLGSALGVTELLPDGARRTRSAPGPGKPSARWMVVAWGNAAICRLRHSGRIFRACERREPEREGPRRGATTGACGTRGGVSDSLAVELVGSSNLGAK